ncbi:HIRAN domain-containing protein [Sphingopyxis flava]|uniref:HIRAN domain-containing protein n=1 Tax=Sphingopyxis flava TaxID=1507287 RepID=A0A1T4ZWQ1_9SPHN|nr:HIRAN domain-containing protein [Sphingopyxis flava]SKB26909.1 HIRAN domain-containing protein [Sphingopyxis flava]
MPAQITLPIVGSQFPNKGRKAPSRRFAIELCAPGDPIELKPEPENEHDENAIAVMSGDGIQMGYLPAERAPYVGMMMRRGEVRAIFQGQPGGRPFARIAFGGEVPTLPPRRAEEVQQQEWWPDEIWPDD